MADDRFEIAYVRGVKMDKWEAQRLSLLLAKFPRLIITQGPWSNAEASGGTHKGAGVVDLYLGGHKWQDVLRYAFEIGWFGWHRAELWIGKARIWKEHLHLGIRGHKGMAASLKAQEVSWRARRNGLKGNAADTFTYRPKGYTSPAPYVVKAPAKVATKPKTTKPGRVVRAWFNAAFLNTHWNSIEGGKPDAVRRTAPRLAKAAAKGFPAVVGFAEIRHGQLSTMVAAMKAEGYLLTAYVEGNMLAVFHRSHVTIVGWSFDPFERQDGGNIEGVLRVKVRIMGSRAQLGFLHLDHDSAEVKKRSNLRETVASLERFGKKTLLPDWRSRTLILGDFNDDDVAEKVLPDYGFRRIVDTRLDKAYVGSARPDRGGDSDRVPETDHPRILVRMGRY